MLNEEELVAAMDGERHRGLKTWKGAVYKCTASLPQEERYGLTSQPRRAGVSTASNIAEGSRRLPSDNKNSLRYALGSPAKCDTRLIIAESLGYGTCTKTLKARIMSLTMGIRAYAEP